jgi:hypothetical protein
MGRMSWAIGVYPKYNHKYPYKKEQEETKYIDEEKINVPMNAAIKMMWLETKECCYPPEAGGSKGTDSPQHVERNHRTADTLVSNQRN